MLTIQPDVFNAYMITVKKYVDVCLKEFKVWRCVRKLQSGQRIGRKERQESRFGRTCAGDKRATGCDTWAEVFG